MFSARPQLLQQILRAPFIFYFVLIGFFVTEHVRSWCDSIGLDLPLNLRTQSIQSSPSGMVFNPDEEMAACVWHWKYQLICLKAISV